MHTQSYVTCRDVQKSPQKLAAENYYHDISNPSLTEKKERRKGEDGIELEVLDSSEQPVKDKGTTEASHYMSLMNGNSDHVCQSLKPGKQQSASVNVCEEGSVENHYQALSEATKPCDSNLYQSLSFGHTSSNSHEQPEKDKCTTEANHYMSLTNYHSENVYQPLKLGKQPSSSVNVGEKGFLENHYQALSEATKHCD